MSEKIVILETAEDFIKVFGALPDNNEHAITAAISWLNTPQDHEPDEEK